MADISRIKIDESIYDIKDQELEVMLDTLLENAPKSEE